jgi:hypothetical protein
VSMYAGHAMTGLPAHILSIACVASVRMTGWRFAGTTKGDFMNTVQLLRFHEGLNEAIRLWARMITALYAADTIASYKIAFLLLGLQPDAHYVDTVE